MTIEELLAKRLSQEIDCEVLAELLKGVDTPEQEIETHVNILRKNSDTDIQRDWLGGNDGIHKPKD